MRVRTGADGSGAITSISATATAALTIAYTRCRALPMTVRMQRQNRHDARVPRKGVLRYLRTAGDRSGLPPMRRQQALTSGIPDVPGEATSAASITAVTPRNASGGKRSRLDLYPS